MALQSGLVDGGAAAMLEALNLQGGGPVPQDAASLLTGLPSAGAAVGPADVGTAQGTITEDSLVFSFAAVAKLGGDFRNFFVAALGLDEESTMGDLTSIPDDVAKLAFTSTPLGEGAAPPMVVGKAMKAFKVCVLALPPPGSAVAAALASAAPAQPKAEASVNLKPMTYAMSQYFDQHDHSSFEKLPNEVYEKLILEYFQIAGGTPSEAENPTPEQLAALAQRLLRKGVPAADFGVWGPFGTRRVAHQDFEQTVQVNGQWQKVKVSGPANFQVWLASWRIFTAAALHLGVASIASLKSYEDGIATLNTLFPGKWAHLYLADMCVRKERWSVLSTHLAIGLHTPKSAYDPKRPWDYIIRASAYGVEEPALLMFWQNRVLIPLQNGASVAGAQQTMEALEGNVQQHHGRSEGAPPAKKPRGRTRGASPSAPVGREVSAQACHSWNAGKCTAPCPAGRRHVCSVCFGDHVKSKCGASQGGGGRGKKGGGGGKATPKWGKRSK